VGVAKYSKVIIKKSKVVVLNKFPHSRFPPPPYSSTHTELQSAHRFAKMPATTTTMVKNDEGDDLDDAPMDTDDSKG
jgi:hypothetical protein